MSCLYLCLIKRVIKAACIIIFASCILNWDNCICVYVQNKHTMHNRNCVYVHAFLWQCVGELCVCVYVCSQLHAVQFLCWAGIELAVLSVCVSLASYHWTQDCVGQKNRAFQTTGWRQSNASCLWHTTVSHWSHDVIRRCPHCRASEMDDWAVDSWCWCYCKIVYKIGFNLPWCFMSFNIKFNLVIGDV